MNFYAFTWMMLGIIYGSCFMNAPTWVQAGVGIAIGLLAAMWPRATAGKGESQ